ncbi:hypothetical protein ACFX15_001151 [Malus domestica]
MFSKPRCISDRNTDFASNFQRSKPAPPQRAMSKTSVIRSFLSRPTPPPGARSNTQRNRMMSKPTHQTTSAMYERQSKFRRKYDILENPSNTRHAGPEPHI